MQLNPVVLLALASVPFLFNTGLQVSGYNNATVTAICWSLAAIILIWAGVEYARNWNAVRRGKGLVGLESWYFIALCLVIAILAIAGAAYGFGLRAAIKGPPPSQGNDTHLSLKFGPAGSTPIATDLANIWRWYALASIAVVILPDGQRKEVKSWNLFMTFDKPVEIKQVIVDGLKLPQYEVKDRDVRSVVVAFLGDIVDTPLRVRVDSSIGSTPQPIKSNTPAETQQTASENSSRQLSPRAVRELLEALNEARDLQDKFIAPTMGQIDSWAVNWRGVLRNSNGAQLYSRLRDELKTHVWEKIDTLIEKNKNYQSKIEAVFALDHPVAKNELSRSLQVVIEAIQRLPPNSPPEMDDLLEPQFKELIKQSNLGWGWVTEVNRRITQMTKNVNNRGVAEYDK